MVSIKAKVISLPDLNGTDHFAIYLSQLGALGKTSHMDRVKLTFLSKAVQYMQRVDFSDLPADGERFLVTLSIKVDGKFYSQTVWLIKPLDRPDIFEMRLNIPVLNSWRFRATFFPHTRNGENYFCFAYPFEKIQNGPNQTNHFRNLTHAINNDVQTNPGKYTNFFK